MLKIRQQIHAQKQHFNFVLKETIFDRENLNKK